MCKIILSILLLSGSVIALAEPPVAINGQFLTPHQVANLERRLGGRIAPGIYLYNAANGCWFNTTNGTSGCLGQGTTQYFSRYGSGERSSNGSWNHYSRSAEGAVGGTGDGCVYTSFGWSNC